MYPQKLLPFPAFENPVVSYGVSLWGNSTIFYSRSWNQLLWNSKAIILNIFVCTALGLALSKIKIHFNARRNLLSINPLRTFGLDNSKLFKVQKSQGWKFWKLNHPKVNSKYLKFKNLKKWNFWKLKNPKINLNYLKFKNLNPKNFEN